MTEEEKKYKEAISALKSLPKVKAKGDFEQKLYRKLRDADSERLSPSIQKLTKPIEKNWIYNIFKPAFVPAVGITLVLIAVIVIYINYMPQPDTTSVTQTEDRNKQEMVIKEPSSTDRSKTLSDQGNEPPVSRELSKSELDEAPTTEGPKSDIETVTPSDRIEEKTAEPPPVMEQKLERKESKEDDGYIKDEEKEMKVEKKVGDMKKNVNENVDETKKAEEKSEQQKGNEGLFENIVKPSMGLDKGKVKDSLKTDSIRSKKDTNKVKGKETDDVNQQNIEKQAEPEKQEPEEEKK
jgi:hypothetical protein